ncbi:hypothetical protein KCH_73060 [Kitasatospora cheerisanensis KCTC 2395]|uniref:Uncharacterized protein n=1 Tax=Kitasatospora cheerisanensis KCTC 2395 TaxID=1348663 RepID=A0A066YHH8_9ACTN|nr:hypothetical protein KCH_73060 [Kitasatospora cheerisanensis KCTC 2395]
MVAEVAAHDGRSCRAPATPPAPPWGRSSVRPGERSGASGRSAAERSSGRERLVPPAPRGDRRETLPHHRPDDRRVPCRRPSTGRAAGPG